MIKKYGTSVLCMTLLLLACNSPMQKIEVNESFTSTSTLAPFQDNDMLLRIMNNASMNLAAKEGKDSTMVLTYKDSAGNTQAPPQFKDVYFFPILSDSSLVKDLVVASGEGLPTFGSGLDVDTPRVHSIDFSKNFAFVVTHPPTAHDYTNSLYITDTSEHILLLSLDYIGIPQGRIEGLPDNWQTSVYELPRNKFDSVGVITNYSTTYFSLKNK